MSYSLERNLLQQLGRTSRAMFAAFEQQVGEALPKMRVLLLVEQHAPIGQKRLAQLMQVDPAALTRLIKQMELDGLVCRCDDPNDGRHTLVSLSGHGVARLAALRPKRQAFLQTALADFTEAELDQMEQLLTKLEARFVGQMEGATP